MTAELPVWVFGRCRWVSGVCRRTTCQDVLEAVLGAPGAAQQADETGDQRPPSHADAANHVIVERWKGVERRLDARVRILKVWSAWGDAQGDVQLLVRRVSEKGARHGSVAGSGRHRRTSAAKPRPGHSRRPAPTVKQHDQEEVRRLMRLILAQGETIAGQLRRLREREAQIERLEAETHTEREARHGKDYVLAAYLREHDNEVDDADDADEVTDEARCQPGATSGQPPDKQPQDTPRTSRQPAQPGRPGRGIRPRLLQVDESDAEREAEATAGPPELAEPPPPPGSQGTQADTKAAELGPESPPEDGDVQAHIALWEKVVKVNKRLEHQEERLVRLYVGFRRSAPDGVAVDDREQLQASLMRLQQDIDDGRRSLQANAVLLTETEALLDAKRRLLHRLLAEMEAVDMDTARLLAARDGARDAAAVQLPSPPGPVAMSSCAPAYSVSKGLDNDSNSDTGLSSLHSSSEEGVYILDTLV